MNLKEFLKIVGQQGKVVIVGDDGDVRGVFVSFDEYQKMDHEAAAQPKPTKEDVAEQINREIIQAQLQEVVANADGGSGGRAMMDTPIKDEPPGYAPESMESIISRRAQELFKSVPFEGTFVSPQIPPNSPHEHFRTPEVATNSDEEIIKPNFDDI